MNSMASCSLSLNDLNKVNHQEPNIVDLKIDQTQTEETHLDPMPNIPPDAKKIIINKNKMQFEREMGLIKMELEQKLKYKNNKNNHSQGICLS